MFLTAWVGSIAMMGIGIYGPLIARLYRRFGARAISFVGTIICAVSLAVTLIAPSILCIVFFNLNQVSAVKSPENIVNRIQ